MVEEKRKLIKELVIDIIFVLILIGLTIIGVTHVFPKNSKVHVMSTHDFECKNAINCECNKRKCICDYCLDDFCKERKKITCNN